jgi:isopenicillin-N epimerase
MSKGYVGFGSFHSDNVEELLRLPDDEYVSPPLPVDVKEPPLFPHGKPKFGDEFAACYYLDLIKWTFVNHGAFGASLRLALTMSNEWRQHAEAQPLLFYDRELFPHCVASLKAIAAFVHASPTDVVFTPNATTGYVCCVCVARA